MLAIENITKHFGGLLALDAVNVTVRRHEIFSIIGPNGAGKTTLFNILTGMNRPEAGRVMLSGHDVTGNSPERIAARGIGRTFQNIRLFGAMTAFENVLVGQHRHIRYAYADALLRTPRFFRQERDARQRAFELLDYMGLKQRAFELARNLPYGEQRQLEIARALGLQPQLLLLDEPAAGMNSGESEQLVSLIRRLRDDRQITVVLIEHDMRVVMQISDRIAVLDHGRKIAEGKPVEIRRDPAVIEAYLGRGALEEIT